MELDLIRDRKKKVKAFMKEATMVSSFTVALSDLHRCKVYTK